MHARRHEVVSRPLGGGLGEIRRFDLEKLEIAQCAPGPLQQPVAQDQVRLQLGTPQIEVPVLEPQLLGGQLLAFAARHRNGRRLGRAHDAQRCGVDFHVAGRKLGIAHRGGSRDHFAFDQDHRFGAEFPGGGDDIGRRPAGTEGDLHEPIAIAQVDEHDPAEVATPVHPPSQTDALAHVLFPQRARTVSSKARPTDVYAIPPPSASRMIR